MIRIEAKKILINILDMRLLYQMDSSKGRRKEGLVIQNYIENVDKKILHDKRDSTRISSGNKRRH